MIYITNQCPTCVFVSNSKLWRAGFCLFSGKTWVSFLCFIWIWNSKTNNPGSCQQPATSGLSNMTGQRPWQCELADLQKKEPWRVLFRETQPNSKNAKTRTGRKQPKTTGFPIPSQSHSQCSDTFCLIIFRFCLKVWPVCDLYSSLQSISKPYLSRGSRVQSNLSTTKHDKSNSCSCQHRNHLARIMVTYQLT